MVRNTESCRHRDVWYNKKFAGHVAVLDFDSELSGLRFGEPNIEILQQTSLSFYLWVVTNIFINDTLRKFCMNDILQLSFVEYHKQTWNSRRVFEFIWKLFILRCNSTNILCITMSCHLKITAVVDKKRLPQKLKKVIGKIDLLLDYYFYFRLITESIP